MSNFVTIRHATVVRDSRAVLHDLSLTIVEGEQIALLGPNGCGKSTLLKLLTHELYPVAGPETEVALFGSTRWDLAQLRRKLGVVQSDLPGGSMLNISAREAVLTGFFSSARLWPNHVVTAAMSRRAAEVLLEVGAESFAEQKFGHLSAGQQRRILIARALVASANCLLLDEPSNALDLRAQQDFRELLGTLAAAGTTMLLITHQLSDIVPAIGRVLLMRDGRILADGARDSLLTEGTLSELFGVSVRLFEHDGVLHAA